MNVTENYQRYANDPWAFLSECVFTKNQVSAGDAVQKYPQTFLT